MILFGAALALVAIHAPLFAKLAAEARINALVRERYPDVWARAQCVPARRRPLFRFFVLGPLSLLLWPTVPRSYDIPWDRDIGRLRSRLPIYDVVLLLFAGVSFVLGCAQLLG